jgi:transposase
MEAYSMDLRKRVLADADAGLPTKGLAEKYSVSRAWVRRLKQRLRERGQIAPGKPGGRRPRIIDRDALAQAVADKPDATLAELREKLGLTCSLSALWQALAGLRITFKKSR